jgi:myo-inositol-1(or 4)-monophosphatase
MLSSPSEIDSGLKSRAAAALLALVEAARLAGEIAMRDFRIGAQTRAGIEYKHGGSPVTEADLAVDSFLKTRLSAQIPEAGWLSEETADDPARLTQSALLVVDPIDGTRAFVAGDPRWAVSIALVVDHRAVAGVVHAPALGETYAASTGAGATLNGAPIGASLRRDLDGAKIAGPRPLIARLAASSATELLSEPKIPSLAYRLARVASGSLDGAFAAADSHDWDIAGADILLSEAGARLTDAEGRPLSYNRAAIRHGALAAAPIALLPAMIAALRPAVTSRTAGNVSA